MTYYKLRIWSLLLIAAYQLRKWHNHDPLLELWLDCMSPEVQFRSICLDFLASVTIRIVFIETKPCKIYIKKIITSTRKVDFLKATFVVGRRTTSTLVCQPEPWDYHCFLQLLPENKDGYDLWKPQDTKTLWTDPRTPHNTFFSCLAFSRWLLAAWTAPRCRRLAAET